MPLRSTMSGVAVRAAPVISGDVRSSGRTAGAARIGTVKPAVTPTKPGCSGSALAGNRPLVAGLIDRLSTAPVRGADGTGSITGPPGPNALSAPGGGVGQP